MFHMVGNWNAARGHETMNAIVRGSPKILGEAAIVAVVGLVIFAITQSISCSPDAKGVTGNAAMKKAADLQKK